MKDDSGEMISVHQILVKLQIEQWGQFSNNLIKR